MLLPYVQDVCQTLTESQPPVNNFEQVASHCATGFVLDLYTAATVLKEFGVTTSNRQQCCQQPSLSLDPAYVSILARPSAPVASPTPRVTSPVREQLFEQLFEQLLEQPPAPTPSKESATENKSADRCLKRKRQVNDEVDDEVPLCSRVPSLTNFLKKSLNQPMHDRTLRFGNVYRIERLYTRFDGAPSLKRFLAQ